MRLTKGESHYGYYMRGCHVGTVDFVCLEDFFVELAHLSRGTIPPYRLIVI